MPFDKLEKSTCQKKKQKKCKLVNVKSHIYVRQKCHTEFNFHRISYDFATKWNVINMYVYFRPTIEICVRWIVYLHRNFKYSFRFWLKFLKLFSRVAKHHKTSITRELLLDLFVFTSFQQKCLCSRCTLYARTMYGCTMCHIHKLVSEKFKMLALIWSKWKSTTVRTTYQTYLPLPITTYSIYNNF